MTAREFFIRVIIAAIPAIITGSIIIIVMITIFKASLFISIIVSVSLATFVAMPLAILWFQSRQR